MEMNPHTHNILRASPRSIVEQFEIAATGIEGCLPALRIKQLPEYLAVLDAINRYADTVERLVDEIYKAQR